MDKYPNDLEGIIGLYAIILPFIIRTLSFYSTLAEFGLIFLIGIEGIDRYRISTG